ncbi:DUF389 domain-containing protein, partial [Nocardioides sp.]|uniref:DUF389 domain-containing protein n=1 Tax=Nocardioides sp. TaxID=35761 RepID=UPI002B26DEAB
RRTGPASGLVTVGVLAGVALMLVPVQADRVLTLVTGGALVLLGLREAARALRAGTWWGRAVTGGALLLPIGVALALVSAQLVTIGVALAGTAVLAHVAISVGVRLGLTDIDRTEDTRPLLLSWLTSRADQVSEREQVVRGLFFEGSQTLSRSIRFALMMLFASVIAAMGVLVDSTVVVIGAMLVAPLINPMMGMALSLASGWPHRLSRSAAAVLGGTAISVGTGWLLATLFDAAIDLDTNTQVTSRANPTLSDLVIAVAAGAAGAYALSRPDVSASLPGVAIAISLVPPLSVVGVTLQQGAAAQALGTFLLFLTNLTAILVVGMVVFLLTGVAALGRGSEGASRVRTSLVGVLVLALFVTAALTLNSRRIIEDSLAADDVRRSIVEWLGRDSEFAIVSVTIDVDTVTVVLAGPGDPPTDDALAADVADDLDRPVDIDLQWVPRERRVIVSP